MNDEQLNAKIMHVVSMLSGVAVEKLDPDLRQASLEDLQRGLDVLLECLRAASKFPRLSVEMFTDGEGEVQVEIKNQKLPRSVLFRLVGNGVTAIHRYAQGEHTPRAERYRDGQFGLSDLMEFANRQPSRIQVLRAPILCNIGAFSANNNHAFAA
jgi:hypothetical protein